MREEANRLTCSPEAHSHRVWRLRGNCGGREGRREREEGEWGEREEREREGRERRERERERGRERVHIRLYIHLIRISEETSHFVSISSWRSKSVFKPRRSSQYGKCPDLRCPHYTLIIY